MMRASFGLLFVALTACEPVRSDPVATEASEPRSVSQPPSPAPAPASAGARESFGAPIDPSVPEVALADLAREPGRYAGQVVRTRGRVARVCQRMGCWMELGADGVTPVRVPMGGHAFFLPRDCQGRTSEVQGRVTLAELSPEVRAHLESEGASSTAGSLSIEASGVRLE